MIAMLVREWQLPIDEQDFRTRVEAGLRAMGIKAVW
jgi:hypothetical protein